MAVSTTTTQYVLPGLDTTMQSNMQIALNSNSTLAQVLATTGAITSKLLKPVTVKFNTSGNWTRPANTMSSVEVIAVGGGGGGGSSHSSGHSGGGGGGGQVIRRFVDISSVATGSNIYVTIGNGGTSTSGSTNTNGGNGGNTTFGTFLTAYGGAGGAGYGNIGPQGPGGSTGGGGSRSSHSGGGGGGGAGSSGKNAYC